MLVLNCLLGLNNCQLLLVDVKPIEHRRHRQFNDTIYFV